MSIAQGMLAEFEPEAKTTRKFLEHLPEDKLSWKPHEKSHTAGELGLHIATIPGGVLMAALPDQSPLPDFKAAWKQPKTVKEILDGLDWSIATVRKELPKIDDKRMHEIWSGTANGKPVFTMPRVVFLRMIMLNHWYHHRGQLGVYLRLMGTMVPGSYGPSGDEEK